MAYIQANTDGRLHDAATPSISPLDRGFLYGDSVYEVWRTHGDHVFAYLEHWERLERSAGALGLVPPVSSDGCLIEIGRTIGAYREATGWDGACYIRLQISRGCGALGLDPALAVEAGYILYVQKLAELEEARLEEGLRLHLAHRYRRNLRASIDPATKTGNYMNSLLCLREARAEGADDVVMLNQADEVTEASTANLFLVEGNRVVTPPLSSGLLGGVTRQILLHRIARPAGLVMMERRVARADLKSFDECFLASTTRDVVPVRSIDEIAYRTGPATVSRHLKTAFGQYLESHPGTPYRG